MTTIGMIFLMTGVFVIAMSWNANPKNGIGIGAGALLTLGGTLIGIGGNPARDMPNGSPAMVVMGFLLAIGGIALVATQLVAAGKNVKKSRATAQRTQLIGFYETCVREGVQECTSPRNVQKAQLIANRMNLAYPEGIAALYEQAKKEKLGDDILQQNRKMQEQRNREQLRHRELTRYASCTGREKRIRMLSDQRDEALSRAKTLRDGSMAIVSASQQKEHDWAIHGGIASGIAGGAAGVATALDIQQKNAQIRAQNAANLQALSPLIGASFDAESRARREAEELSGKISEAQIKLVGEDSAEAVLSHLRFSDTKVEVSETGAFTVTTRVHGENLKVFDVEDAVADGTVVANVYQNNRMIGTAQLVLPVYGVGRTAVTLEGIGLTGAGQGSPCSVKFTASNLWVMEV